MSLQRHFQICFLLSFYGGLTSAAEANIRSKRRDSNTVDIAMFTDSSAPGKKFSVYVDSTMTSLHIEVKVKRSSPVIIVGKPSGGPGPHPKLNNTAGPGTTATVDVAITAADYGIWTLTKLDANTWSVKVQGESPLDFSYQFLEGGMIQIPITGDPIQGETYTARISVPEYATVQKIDMFLEFVTEKSTPANMMSPIDKGSGTYEVAPIKMLEKNFMIGIQGRDKSGNFLRRIRVIKPVAWILYAPTFSAGVKLYENTKLDIPFYVINKMSTDQDIDIKIQDTQGLAEAPKIISATLTPGQNYSGHFVLNNGLLGVTTEVTITVSQYIGNGQIKQGPSEVKQFKVERNPITTTSTSVFTTSRKSATGGGSTKSLASHQAQVNTAASSTKPSGNSKSATYMLPSSHAQVSTVTSTLTARKVSTILPISHLNAKSTVQELKQHDAVAASSPSSLNAGKPTTAAPDEDKDGSTFSKREVFGAAIVSGVSAGVLLGVAALVTMGLVFKHSIKKRKVTPEEKKKQRTLSEHNELART